MIDVSWRIEDEPRDDEPTGAPRPLLGTWHYLKNSLRRGWRTCAVLALVGAELGLAMVLLFPPASTATAKVLMAHPANLDGQSAMATDVSFLNTREVAARTLRTLHLQVPADAFLSTVSAEPLTAQVLAISVSAPDDRTATARTNALTVQYLAFRAEQLRSLSKGLIEGYQARIDALRPEVADLSAEYAEASAKGAAEQNRAADVLTRRSQINAHIVEMQAALEDASLSTDAAIASTHVIDPATVQGRSPARHLVLSVASGLIAGTGLGMGFVLFRAFTSTVVRRRQDVAEALGVPVRFSVASRGPGERRRGPLRFLRRTWRGGDLWTLVHGLSSTVWSQRGATPAGAAGRHAASGSEGRRAGVALVAIDNTRAAAEVVAALAGLLAGYGRAVLLVDLSLSGALVDRLPAQGGDRGDLEAADGMASEVGGAAPTVFRPAGSVSLARGLREATDSAGGDPRSDTELREMWDAVDVVLVLADIDPGLDAESLATWVGQVVPLVTAGQSSPELLETTAELVRAAGLELPFAMVVGCDSTDESLGLMSRDASDPAAGSWA
ncbi:hypothetical protein [Phycicoccus sp. Soil748]|uniref:hypothetical protein n=1 Tax=Phycicoccus sp. Soil748 TaxID=1736397 RepID=UPI000703257B|nr:hypothetical protein [Phycicoccus sp. Soil748]KRE55469.1 hypothetical protein ASG70_08925 [Phycicoccus sp. Soil748]